MIRLTFYSFNNLGHLLLISGLGCSGVVGQSVDLPEEEAYELEPFEVTASSLESSLADAPVSVEVVTAEEMENRAVRSLPEALSELPGVMVQKTANGQGSPYLRGFTGYRTLALVDGIRYNNSVYRDGPNEYFSLIDLYTLDRIELIEGPTSVRYGSDAIGGTLDLHTKQSYFIEEEAGKLYTHGLQSYRYSSREKSHVSRTMAEVGYGDVWGMLLGYTYQNFGDVDAAKIGRQRHTGYGQYGLDARFDMKISEQWQLTLSHRESEQDDVWRTHSTIYARSFSGTEVGKDLRRAKDLAYSLSYAKLVGRDLDSAVDEVSFTVSYQTWDEDGDRIRGDGSQALELFDSRMLGVDLQLKSDVLIGQLIYGADIYHDRVDSARTDYHSDGSLDQVRIQGPIGDDSIYTLFGAYIQGVFPLDERFELVVGSRFTRAKAEIGRFENPVTGLANSYEDAWNSVVSSVRLSYHLSEVSPWIVWGGVSQAFRAPNIADISRYGGSRSNETEIAATDLEPEHFLTFELGVKGEDGPFAASSTVYYTQIKDYISSTPTGRIVDGLTEVMRRNSGRGGIFGVEVSAAYQMTDCWKVKGNVSYLRGNLETYVDASSFQRVNEPLSRVQPLTVNLAVRWDSPEWKWWGEFACTLADRADRLSSGDKGDVQRIPPGGTPGYALLGFYGGCVINEHLRVNVALKNVLDQAYRAHGSGSNEPGFGVNAGITMSF